MSRRKDEKSQRKKCSAINCKNYQWNTPHLAFHRFPKDPDRCARWVHNLRNASLEGISTQQLHQSYRVCSGHFHSSQFKRPSDVHAGLIWSAVPTRVNVPNPPPTLAVEKKRKPPKKRQELPLKKRKLIARPSSPDVAATGPTLPPPPSAEDIPGPSSQAPHTNTTPKHHDCIDSMKAQIRRLNSQVCRLKSQVKDLKQKKSSKAVAKGLLMKELQRVLPAKSFAFVYTQIRMCERKAPGFRWSTKDKAFFLSLLHTSPKCYRLLCKVFSMPSVRTLKKVMKSVDFKPGFNRSVLTTMQKAMENTKPMDKVCAIITDKMSIKEAVHYNESADKVEGFEDLGKGQRSPYVANYASAFMVKGLFKEWKQLFGYCFSSGPIPHDRLQSLLFEGIRELRSAGMECLVFICDQGAGNRAMLTRLGVTKDQPYFDVDGIRIFCMWDPPHLIKNIRNNWRNHGFQLDGNEITWAILEDLYAYDSKQEIRLCCRLTKKHVYLPPFASMHVRFATQVLSHSVAVGIKTLSEVKRLTGKLQQNYIAAAKFCESFNGLFDCFNSKQLKDSHKLKSGLSEVSAHFPFLDSCMEWLPRLRLLDASTTKQVPCVEGWQHNILCLKMLWCDLRERHQVSFLLTNGLNQDCLENAYSSIRARGGNRDNPDSVQFECEHQAVATGLMFNNCEKTNCEEDLNTFLLQISTYASQNCPPGISDAERIAKEHSYSQGAPDSGATEIGIHPVESNQSPSNQSVSDSGDFEGLMDCTEVRVRETLLMGEKDKSGSEIGLHQLSTPCNAVDLRIQRQSSTRTSLQEHKSGDTVLKSDFDPPEGVLDMLSKMTPVSSSSAFDLDGNVLVYIAGYIVNKVVGKFSGPEGPCNNCSLLTTYVPTDSRYTFLKDKQYTDLVLGEKGLKVPSTALVDLITALESNFRKNVNSVIHTLCLGQKLFNSSMEVVSECSEVVCGKEACRHLLVYMVKLFNRIRIHHVLRTQNRRISQPNQKRNRKFLKLSHN
ncbi:uncharacterized protein LOC117269502 [Epinephelus lanceolatus]